MREGERRNKWWKGVERRERKREEEEGAGEGEDGGEGKGGECFMLEIPGVPNASLYCFCTCMCV